MKTRTLQEIKDEVANEICNASWKYFTSSASQSTIELAQDRVCRRAQLEACTLTLQKAETIAIIRGCITDMPISDLKITSESNIVIIE